MTTMTNPTSYLEGEAGEIADGLRETALELRDATLRLLTYARPVDDDEGEMLDTLRQLARHGLAMETAADQLDGLGESARLRQQWDDAEARRRAG